MGQYFVKGHHLLRDILEHSSVVCRNPYYELLSSEGRLMLVRADTTAAFTTCFPGITINPICLCHPTIGIRLMAREEERYHHETRQCQQVQCCNLCLCI